MSGVRQALRGLTTRGKAFLAAGGTCALLALVFGHRDLLRIGILLAALPLVSAFLVGRSRHRLGVVREVRPTHVPAGTPATITLHLRNDGRMPTGLVLLEDQLPYVLGMRPRFVIDHMSARWRRDVSYTVRAEVRGRYQLGPLALRVSDPFGLIELDRTFSSTNSLIVTPPVHRVAPIALRGEKSGTGDNRPQAFAVGSAEDVTVREYRRGDDLRRVHWRSTARVGDLMVRREEKPWQSRATLLLDTRGRAHRGTGPASSLEWAIVALASVGVHLAGRGYALRLMTDVGDSGLSNWHERGSGTIGDTGPLLESLAVVGPSREDRINARWIDEQSQSGLMVAVLGRLEPPDVATLARLRLSADTALAIVLDVPGWSRGGAVPPGALRSTTDKAVERLRRQGWRVVVARPNDTVAAVWEQLARRNRHNPSVVPSAAQAATPSTASPAGEATTVPGAGR